MRTVIVFDGIQIIAAIVALAAGIIILACYLADRYFSKHPRSRFKKICYKLFGVDKDLY